MDCLKSFDGIHVGDVLQVRPDLYRSAMATGEMDRLAGTNVTVADFRLGNTVILINEDGCRYWWSHEMFLQNNTSPVALSEYLM